MHENHGDFSAPKAEWHQDYLIPQWRLDNHDAPEEQYNGIWQRAKRREHFHHHRWMRNLQAIYLSRLK